MVLRILFTSPLSGLNVMADQGTLHVRRCGVTVCLTCVRLHVLVEILLHVEVLATPLAHELLVSNVDAHVRPQLILILETLVTILFVHMEIDGVGESSSWNTRRELCNISNITCYYVL